MDVELSSKNFWKEYSGFNDLSEHSSMNLKPDSQESEKRFNFELSLVLKRTALDKATSL